MSIQELSDSVNRLALQIQDLTARLDTALLARDAPVAKKAEAQVRPRCRGSDQSRKYY